MTRYDSQKCGGATARRRPALLAVGSLLLALASLPCGVGLCATPLINRLEAGQHQTIVVYGTSLTANGSWVSQVANSLNSQFPGQITWINSGQSGKASNTGIALLQSTVLAHSPDAVFIEFAMNDAFTAYAPTDLDYGITPEDSRANLNSIIDSILVARPDAQVVLQTMNPTWDAPNGNGSAAKRPQLSTYYQGYRDVAAGRDVMLVDNNLVWQKAQTNTPDVFHSFVSDGTHPDAAGYATVATPAILWNLGADTGLTLVVDLDDGRAVLQNRTDEPIALISYSILSASGALRTSWSSLASRGNPAWVEANPNSLALSELNATGSTTLAPGTETNLGEPWDVTKALDLQLVYQGADGARRTGTIVYASLRDDLALSGDFDHDGIVDGADFLAWQREFNLPTTPFAGADDNGDGTVDAADLPAWAQGFGTPIAEWAAAATSSTAVAEPASAGIAAALALTRLIAGRLPQWGKGLLRCRN
ncbi:MAG: hypothetical protein KDA44_10450 [Planctomycetales bacterium]|nr:hypothetical protein [Planctomycetales bacterium]